MPHKCDVRQSSSKNLSHWLRVLERNGYIVTSIRMDKKQGRASEGGDDDKEQVQRRRGTTVEQVRAKRRNRGTPVKIIRHIASP